MQSEKERGLGSDSRFLEQPTAGEQYKSMYFEEAVNKLNLEIIM